LFCVAGQQQFRAFAIGHRPILDTRFSEQLLRMKGETIPSSLSYKVPYPHSASNVQESSQSMGIANTEGHWPAYGASHYPSYISGSLAVGNNHSALQAGFSSGQSLQYPVELNQQVPAMDAVGPHIPSGVGENSNATGEYDSLIHSSQSPQRSEFMISRHHPTGEHMIGRHNPTAENK
ncbi:hypothetical protein Anas_06918, partial [Armadillidium nasatum]